MKVFEPYHFVRAELVSSLKKIDVVSLRSRCPQLVKIVVNYQNQNYGSFQETQWIGQVSGISFKHLIHSTDGLNDIDRYNYLKKCLYVSAAACVSGLSS